jgi:hypothetical protein
MACVDICKRNRDCLRKLSCRLVGRTEGEKWQPKSPTWCMCNEHENDA